MHLISKENRNYYIIYNLNNIRNKYIINQIIRLIKVGIKEEAFECIEDLSEESVIIYWNEMSGCCNYNLISILDNNFKIIGYIDYVCIPPSAEILGIIVDPYYRRKGFGSMLLKLAELNIKKSCNIIYTYINIKNHKSKSFFKSNGFKPLKQYKQFTGCHSLGVEQKWIKFLI